MELIMRVKELPYVFYPFTFNLYLTIRLLIHFILSCGESLLYHKQISLAENAISAFQRYIILRLLELSHILKWLDVNQNFIFPTFNVNAVIAQNPRAWYAPNVKALSIVKKVAQELSKSFIMKINIYFYVLVI